MKIKVRARKAKHAKLKREICRVVRKICVAPSKKTRKRQRWRSVCYFRLILHTNDLAAFAAAKWRIFHIAEIFSRGMQQMVLKPGKIAHTRRLHTRQQLPQLPFDGSLKFLLRCCCSVNRFQSAKANTINRRQVPAASQNEQMPLSCCSSRPPCGLCLQPN